MKKMLSILLAVMMVAALTVSLVGCGSEQAAPAGDEQEVLRVGMNAGFQPFEFKDENNEIVGFDIDIIEAMAQEMNMKVEYKDMDFGALITALNNGEFDVIASAMTIRDDRKEKADFTDPYFNAGQAIAVMKDNNEIAGLDDLNGKIVSGQSGTTGIIMMQEMKEKGELDVTVRDYPNIAQCFMDMGNGVVDAIVTDIGVVQRYAQQHPDIKIVGDTLSEEEYGMAVKKDNAELLDSLNAALDTIEENGTYDNIYEKWFMGE